MDKYILVSRADFGIIKLWAKVRKVNIELVPDEKAPISVTIRKGIYALSDFPVKIMILKVNEDDYKKLKPFVRDL